MSDRFDDGAHALDFFAGNLLEHPLHGVDRKYLYSFWRECFQNRQQLFLVFLRAEPLTVGGTSGEALASSQLGARGVALVWRDPVSTPRDNNGESGGALTRAGTVTKDSFSERQKTRGPNRTRVLFYHQFD